MPVDKPIVGLEFVDRNTGWAVTRVFTYGHVIYTCYNERRNKLGHSIQSKQRCLYSMDALDNNICYAGGSDVDGNSIIYKTINSGLNWIPNLIGPNRVADDMFFVNADSGYICDALAPSVYTTTDGGASWVQRPHPVQSPKVLFFFNYDTGYCGGDKKIFKTNNSGLNWFELFDFAIFNNRNITGIQFLSNTKGWTSLTNNAVAFTVNGGTNWSISNPSILNLGDIFNVFFLDDLYGWSGSQSAGYIFKTTTGGFNWIIQNDTSGSRTLFFTNTIKGWSGYIGISKTTNGGVTFIREINTEIPNTFKLNQNFPNPFNPNTKIRFTIIKNSEVTISVYNILGKEVFNYKSDGNLNAGIYEYEFIPDNLSSGVYIYKLTAKSDGNVFSDSKKMIYLK
ncbi:MAG: T9SS type A sorting domain-containing protein [Ignavibacteria bacterium]|nr:T9SS type A sorting domain-containing protein [Ignavibacteria bacterium]